MTEDERRRWLRDAARRLIALAENCPDLFVYVLPISDDVLYTLIEIADYDDKDTDHAAD